MYDVLVTGAETHQGIIVIRSLGTRGVRMLVTGTLPDSKGFYSKYVDHHEFLLSPDTEPDAFVDAVLDLVRASGIPYIYPVTESSLIALNGRREEVEPVAKLIAPPSKLVREALDKKVTLDYVRQVGIKTSLSHYPESTEEAESKAEEWGYPVVLKPQGGPNNSGIGGSFDYKALYVKDRAQLREVLAKREPGQFPMMQDYAFGLQTCYTCFVENGKDIHSYFQDDCVRMLPMWGGVGARRLSREIDPKIREQSSQLFRLMNWEGCAQTQWKGPGKDGEYTFLEVTVRLMASVGSPVYSGVDLPWMQYQYFTGQKVDRAETFNTSMHSRWFRGDTLTVIRHLAGDQPKSGDPLPPRLVLFGSWLYDFVRPGLRNDVESLSDPMPGIIELKSLALDIFRLLYKRTTELLPFLGKIKRAFKTAPES